MAFKDIIRRAKIVWRNPDLFQYGSFEAEEVGVMTGLFVPNMVITTYVLWGITPRGVRAKCCQFDKMESKEDYIRRNGCLICEPDAPQMIRPTDEEPAGEALPTGGETVV